MQRFILFYEKVNLWGKAVYLSLIHIFIDLYSQTKEARREVQQQINEALEYIKKAIPAIQNYQAALLRQSEVLVALTQCNKAFVCAYEPLRKQIFLSLIHIWMHLRTLC